MNNLRRRALTLGLILVGMLTVDEVASAKCGWLLFHVRGQLEGALPLEAVVEVFAEPEANARQPSPKITGQVVEATMRFDSLRSYSWWRGHNCSRQPKRVGLRVLIQGVERYRATKAFPADFEERADFEWSVKEPIKINLVPRQEQSRTTMR